VATQRRAVDDVVVHQRAEVQQLDRGRAAHRLAPVAAPRQVEHESSPVTRAGRRDRCQRVDHRLAERGDDGVDPAVDVGQWGSVVRHAARR
jgi:hypothetical protein